jgi:hypothetical protein
VMTRLRTLLRDETGLGMPIAMSVLVVVMIIAGLSLASSTTLHQSSERDRSVTRALGPADAALQRLAWRLDQADAATLAGRCIVSGGEATPDLVGPADGSCPPAVPVPMGNGNEYTYVAPPAATSAGAPCAGSGAAVGDRCVVSSGTSNGTTRRVQALVNRPVINQVVNPWGLVGRDRVVLGNNVVAWTCDDDVAGTIGSNGSVEFQNGDRLDDTECDGTDDGSWGVTIQSPPAGSVLGAPSGPPMTATHIAPPGFAFPVIDWPTTTNNDLLPAPMYDATTKVLTVTSPLTLAAGSYRLCGLVVDGAPLEIAATGVVKIYIDSPSSGSGWCTSGDGLWLKNNERVNWGANGDLGTDDLAERARRLQIFVAPNTYWETAGNHRPCQGNQEATILICNSSQLAGSIYAPDAKMHWRNGGDLVGFATVRDLLINNGLNHRLPNGMGEVIAGTTIGDPEVAGWTECISTGSGTAGCS